MSNTRQKKDLGPMFGPYAQKNFTRLQKLLLCEYGFYKELVKEGCSVSYPFLVKEKAQLKDICISDAFGDKDLKHIFYCKNHPVGHCWCPIKVHTFTVSLFKCTLCLLS